MKYYIYKIIGKNNNEEFYIGSTNNFSARKSHHKKNVNNKVGKKYWCKLYQYIRANGNWENFEMVILEAGTCENKEYIKQKNEEKLHILSQIPDIDKLIENGCSLNPKLENPRVGSFL